MIDLTGFPRGPEGVVCRLPSGWVLMGESQFLRGYAVLFADPKVADLNQLRGAERAQFLADMTLLGDAVQAVVGALRINYSVLGNVVPILHAHVFPRFETEVEELRGAAFWAFPEAQRSVPAFDLARDAELMAALHDKLVELGGKVAELDYAWRALIK